MKCRYIFLLSVLFSLVSCTFSFKKEVHGQGKVYSVSVEAFADSISKAGVQLVDVRTPREFEEGNIPGSVNIDVMTGHFGEEACELLDKERTVALYCRSGNRSKNAARILAQHGYQVLELGTGFRGWSAAGKKIETGTEKR